MPLRLVIHASRTGAAGRESTAAPPGPIVGTPTLVAQVPLANNAPAAPIR